MTIIDMVSQRSERELHNMFTIRNKKKPKAIFF